MLYFVIEVYGLVAKRRYMGFFASLLHLQEEKLGYCFQSGHVGDLRNHVLLSFQRSIFCEWPVFNVTLLTLKQYTKY